MKTITREEMRMILKNLPLNGGFYPGGVCEQMRPNNFEWPKETWLQKRMEKIQNQGRKTRHGR